MRSYPSQRRQHGSREAVWVTRCTPQARGVPSIESISWARQEQNLHKEFNTKAYQEWLLSPQLFVEELCGSLCEYSREEDAPFQQKETKERGCGCDGVKRAAAAEQKHFQVAISLVERRLPTTAGTEN